MATADSPGGTRAMPDATTGAIAPEVTAPATGGAIPPAGITPPGKIPPVGIAPPGRSADA